MESNKILNVLRSFKEKLLKESESFPIFTSQIEKFLACSNEYLAKIELILSQFPDADK